MTEYAQSVAKAMIKVRTLGALDKIQKRPFFYWWAEIFDAPSWPSFEKQPTFNRVTSFLDWICPNYSK